MKKCNSSISTENSCRLFWVSVEIVESKCRLLCQAGVELQICYVIKPIFGWIFMSNVFLKILFGNS